MDSQDNQLDAGKNLLANAPPNLTRLLDEHLKQGLEAYRAKLAEDLAKEFEILRLENKDLQAANDRLQRQVDDQKRVIQDAGLEIGKNKRWAENQAFADAEKHSAARQKLESHQRQIDGLRKAVVDPRRSTKKDKLVEKHDRELAKAQEEIRQLKHGNTEMISMFHRMTLGQDAMTEMRAFIARMQNQGGSLFREGLVIPEDDGQLNHGGDDGDDELVVIM